MSRLEILVALTSLGVVMVFAVSMAFDLRDQESQSSARRAAKILAATAENARVAGDRRITSATTKEEAIGLLAEGVVGEGVFEEFEYKVNLSDERRAKVLRFLDFKDGNLVYDGDPDID